VYKKRGFPDGNRDEGKTLPPLLTNGRRNDKRATIRRSQLSIGGWRRQRPSQGKRYTVMQDKGDDVRLPPQRQSGSSEALSRRETREQGFGTRHPCVAPQPGKSIKDTKKYFKGKFFMGQSRK